jgi:hypothetical protein
MRLVGALLTVEVRAIADDCVVVKAGRHGFCRESPEPVRLLLVSALSPLQKLTLTFVASGALKRIWTRELPSTCGYCASKTLDEAGLKSLEPWAQQKLHSTTS